MPGITLTITGKTDVPKVLSDIERSAVAHQSRMQRNITAGLGQWMGTGIAPNPLDAKFVDSGKKAGMGWLAGFTNNLRGRGGSGVQEMIHVGRATFDSLASGMSPWRVFLQQGPQLLQALTLMGDGFLYLLKRMVPVVAVVAAATAVWMYFEHRVKRLTAALSQIELPDLTPVKLDRLTVAEQGWMKIRDAVREARDAYTSATAQSDRHLSHLHDIFEMENKLLQLRGGGKSQARALEISQNERELAAGKERLKALEDEAKGKAAAIASMGKLPSKEAFLDRGENLKLQHEALKTQVDALNKDVDSIQTPGMWRKVWMTLGGRAIDWSQRVVNGQSDDQLLLAGAAGKNQQYSTQYAQHIAFEKNKKVELDKIAERDRLQAEIAKNEGEQAALQLKLQALPKEQAEKLAIADKIRAAEAGSGGSNKSVTERERIGAMANGMSVSLLDVAKKQHSAILESNKHLAEMVRELAEGGFI